MGCGIGNVEDIPQSGGSIDFSPTQLFSRKHQPIMSGLRLITTSICSQCLHIIYCFELISKIKMIGYISAILRRMVSVGDNCESELKTFCPYFVLYIGDDGLDDFLDLGKLPGHGACRVHTKADIDKSE